MKPYLLAIDQGTTSTRAILFDSKARPVGQAQQEFTQFFPADGWVEHDVEEIWRTTLEVCRRAVAESGVAVEDILSVGITNQRETTVIWERATGRPIHRAIVWQDRRTADYCERLKAEGHEALIRERCGLLIDPYFSATKIRWLLDNVPGAREAAQRGDLAFGTIDSYLLWQLTGGRVHRTDATNASRTMLFNIHRQQWDEDLLKLFDIPAALLPEVCDSSAAFGQLDRAVLGREILIGGVAGDQQAALIGQACFEPGMIKSTYGTGCFMILNTGTQALESRNRLLTTVAYRLKGETTYAIEGSIFVAGAAVQWLRDGLKLIRHAAETEALAAQAGHEQSVYLVPAFTGLGAPYWDPAARGAILGLTRDTGLAEIVTAGLQSVCYQTKDLVEAMRSDGANLGSLRVDGGMVVNDWVMGFLANILDVVVDRPRVTETTALGAAFLAGMQAGIYGGTEEVAVLWQSERRFEPNMDSAIRERLYQGWRDAVRRVRSSAAEIF